MSTMNDDSFKLIEYDVNTGSGHTTGWVVVSFDATDDEIRLAILDDLENGGTNEQ